MLLDAMGTMTVGRNLFSYSAGISALEKGGQWQRALELFEFIPDANTSPKVIIYNAAITACEKGGQWQRALELFAFIPNANLSPNVVSFNAAITACETDGQMAVSTGLA